MKVEGESWGRGFHQELKELKQTPHEWLGQHWGGWKDRKLEEQVGVVIQGLIGSGKKFGFLF